jgi:hypothetical protein
MLERYELAVTIEARIGPSAVQLDQSQQSGHLRLGRHQHVKLGSEPVGVVDEVA